VYIKRYVVTRGERRYAYLRLVESYRDERGRPRHRIVANLGREDELKASGQLEQLAGSFARLDPPLAGTRREVGPLLLVHHYLERLGLVALIDSQLPQRGRALLTHGEVVAALIGNRLCAPAPLYDVAGWASQAALQELLGVPAALLNDDRLGRALDAFAPRAEQVRAACLLQAVERFGLDGSRLHLDLTALRVAGLYERSALVAKGRAADRSFGRQVEALQAVTGEGVPLYVRPERGSAAELSVLGESLERLRALLPPGLLVLVDSAFGRARSLCAADRAGVSFICPLREELRFRERFQIEVGFERLKPLRYVAAREQRLPARKRTRYRGALAPLALRDPETGAEQRFRVAYIWSSEEAVSVAAARERALRTAEAALARVQRGIRNRRYKRHAEVETRVARILAPVGGLLSVTTGERDGRPTLAFARDEEAIAEAGGTDGLYALATNLPGRLSAERVLRLYEQQSLVEQRHRDLKATLRVRPVFLHNDERVAALVSIVGLALLVFGLIELELRGKLGDGDQLPGLLPEGRAARPTGRNILAAFQGLGLTYTRDGIVLDRLTATQRRILGLLQVAIPWPEQNGATPATCGKWV
jgi:Domain of unknown function (DUF4277)/Transposase DDE domain